MSDAFVDLSAAITGFRAFDLHGTGQVEEYRTTVAGIVGDDVLAELLAAWDRVAAVEDLEGALRRDVFSDPRLGPVARNLIKLWYVGIWYELPPEWKDAYGVRELDATFQVSPSSYTEGLMWPAIGANPPGAKGPGYASWTGPPRLGDD